MSTSDATISYINALHYSTSMFLQIWSYLLIVLGTIGHSLNIFIFMRPTLRSNLCTRYFLASPISGINVSLRLLQQIYGIDVFQYSNLSCKTITFIVLWAKYCIYFFCCRTVTS